MMVKNQLYLFEIMQITFLTGRELCVAYDYSTYYAWRNYNCEETLGVICEAVAGIEPPTTTDPPTAPPR